MKKSKILILLIFILIANIVSSKLFFKFDTTEEKLYTLSKSSKEIVATLDEVVEIKYFFSSSDDSVPTVVKNYGNRVKEMLEEFASYSQFLNLEIYDPKADSDEELLAIKYGLTNVQVMNSMPFYIGAVATHKEKKFTVGFFDLRQENVLELEIANMIVQAQKEKEKNTLGIISSFPLMGDEARKKTPWFFLEEVKRTFRIKMLEDDIEEVPDDISVLMILHPNELLEETEYAIEQYILNGGKVAILIDPSARTIIDEEKSKQFRGNIQIATSSNLDYLFDMLKIKYNNQFIVANKNIATHVISQEKMRIRYPFWLSLKKSNYNQNSLLSKSLTSMLLVESGFFSPDKNGYNYISLLNSGKKSGLISANKLNFMRLTDSHDFNNKNEDFSLAGIVSGKFKSVFDKTPIDSLYSKKHLKEAINENSVFVIADVDFLHNRYFMRALDFNGHKVLKKINHNLSFLMNCLDFLCGDTKLITIRSRGEYLRPFDRVLKLEKDAQDKWLFLDKELSSKIQNIQIKLDKLQKEEDKINSDEKRKKEILKFKSEQNEFKKKRRALRKKLRHDIEVLGNVLTILNLTIVPILILIIGMYIYKRRR